MDTSSYFSLATSGGAIGWIGNVFIILGILLVAYRIRSGFLYGCLGNGLWLCKGFLTYQWDLVTIEALIVVLQAFSWLKWGQMNDRSSDRVRPGTDSE